MSSKLKSTFPKQSFNKIAFPKKSGQALAAAIHYTQYLMLLLPMTFTAHCD
ncbi:hypothetical protein ACFPIK_05095 [Algoriphagus aquatilis]|uniref:Uncharacterized protein n=1 Tax=Algoriphagus aquatilis TaxID=490186 RepID=A0ABW0BVA4_9BACT